MYENNRRNLTNEMTFKITFLKIFFNTAALSFSSLFTALQILQIIYLIYSLVAVNLDLNFFYLPYYYVIVLICLFLITELFLEIDISKVLNMTGFIESFSVTVFSLYFNF